MTDFKWEGPYVKVYWSDIERFDGDDRGLARFVRGLIEADKERRRRARYRYVRPDVWEAVLAAFGHRCAYCGRDDLTLVREHRMPKALGGGDGIDNIVPACRPCNQRKYDQHPDRWPLFIEPVWPS